MRLLTWQQRLAVLLLAAFGTAVAVVSWLDSRQGDLRRGEAIFQARVALVREAIAGRFQQYAVLADAAAGFWQSRAGTGSGAGEEAAAGQEAEDWHGFVDRLGLWGQDRGVIGIAHVVNVPAGRQAAFQDEMRRLVSSNFIIHGLAGKGEVLSGLGAYQPAGDELMVVTHLEPRSPAWSVPVLGLDLGSDALRRRAAERARDTGAAAISGPLPLVAGGGGDGGDFLILSPVYRPGLPLSSPAQRRLALQGWVSLAIRGQELLSRSLQEAGGGQLSGAAWHHFIGGNRQQFWQSPGVGTTGRPLYSASLQLPLFGQEWQVDLASTPELEAGVFTGHWRILLANLMLAWFLALCLFMLLHHRQRVLLLKQEEGRQQDAAGQHYRAVIERTAGGYWQIDPHNRRILAVNDSLCRILGYSREELLGRPPTDFCDVANREILRNHMDSLFDCEHRLYDVVMQRKDGAEVCLHMSETTLRAGAGQEVSAVFAMIADMSDFYRLRQTLMRKTRELESSNSDLQQFAYVASHDLQAPLRTVSSYLQLLERRYKGQLSEEACEFIGFASEGARRMSQLINDLLAFSRVETRGGPMGPCELSAACQQALENLHVAVVSSAAVVEILTPLPRVLGDGAQLVSLFQNLLGNALKYCLPETTPHVTITCQEDETGMVMVSIADNGIGIDPSHSERIFLIFQRLHGPEQYEGTGIGLALCKRIIDRHDGRIWVEARGEGRGSVFHFTLHLASQTALLGKLVG